MSVTTPDWLTHRDGALRLGHDGRTWLLLLGGEPHYKLTPAPAGGRHECIVVQTVNGKRLDKGGGQYARAGEALRGGLGGWRAARGWWRARLGGGGRLGGARAGRTSARPAKPRLAAKQATELLSAPSP